MEPRLASSLPPGPHRDPHRDSQRGPRPDSHRDSQRDPHRDSQHDPHRDPVGPHPAGIPLRIVDAFTAQPFGGNQASVCFLGHEVPEAWMQAVAREMNHSETAFVQSLAPSRAEGAAGAPVFGLRWFTPKKEVDLCGHATLATAHALWEAGVLPASQPAQFETRSGTLTCTRGPDGITMDFPANPGTPHQPPAALWQALGLPPSAVLRNRTDYLLVLTDEAAVRSCKPDFAALGRLDDYHGFIVTAQADDPALDYVCRYFAPAYGIDEDPATGSIQTFLGPYWSQRLGKGTLRMRQLSQRGASMTVQPKGDRVAITGQAVTVATGSLDVAPPSLVVV